MPLVEVLTVTIGSAVSKWLCGLWLGDGLAKEVTGNASDLIAQNVSGYLERRRVVRQFDQIAEVVAIKFEKLIKTEFSLSENESLAAIEAASVSLEATPGHAAISSDYDPITLRATVLASDPKRSHIAGLSEPGEQLYYLLIRDCCYYICEVSPTLPAYHQANSVEILRRETELIEIVRTVLDRLPSDRAIQQESDALASAYEDDYRRFVAQKLDRLVLFGLRVSEYSSRYALSVAYISLTMRGVAESTDPNLRDDSTRHVKKARQEDADIVDDVRRVDEAMIGHDRVFVRGTAGSGKTTLLQWLAVQSARRAFDGALKRWNDLIPIFLQLRRFTEGVLPGPNQFLRYTSAGIWESMPDRWVHDRLSEGRVVLLIDGVDEVPEVRRETVRGWLRDLVSQYPDVKYVVTSRPAAVSEKWLTSDGFVPMEMQPMNLSDIDQFVDHWYDAASRNLPDDETVAELQIYRSALLQSVRANTQLKNLATSPLLCAMLCALNRDRRSQLPLHRVELYRIALEMLLDQRDVQREVPAAISGGLSFRVKLLLLREYAYWLVLNDQSDGTFQELVDRINIKLENLPGIEADGETVAKFLLVRSGLLREAVPGRIDFVHRTFQEYLAALEVVEQDHIGLLVKNSADDQWREVVILSAGLLTSKERLGKLLTGLLDLGDEKRRLRHRLHLLAVACLESEGELATPVRFRISECLKSLLPPRNLTEAREVSSAGALALPLLAQFAASNAPIAAACVRTAALIGGEDALQVLERFATDRRSAVFRELVRAWSAWPDPRKFAREVMALNPLDDGLLSLGDMSLLPYVTELPQLKKLHVWTYSKLHNVDTLRELPQLTSFSAAYNYRLSNIDFLEGCANLVTLNLSNCENLNDFSVIARLPKLRSLTLSGTSVSNLAFLCNHPDLIELKVSNCKKITDWAPIWSLKKLNRIDLSSNSGIVDLEMLDCLDSLETLHLTGCASLVSIAKLSGASRLKDIRLSGDLDDDALQPISTITSLRYVDIIGNRSVSNVQFLTACQSLMQVHLHDCVSLKSLDGLSADGLLAVSVRGCSNVQRLPQNCSFPELRFVDLGDTAISDLTPLSEAQFLEDISISGCLQVRDLSPLNGLQWLRYLNLSGLPETVLQTVHLSRRLHTLVLSSEVDAVSLTMNARKVYRI